MKVFEILEGLNRVPKREVDNPHPSAINDPDDVAWIHGSDKITAYDVIRDILGDKADFSDGEHMSPGAFGVSKSWTPMSAMFSNMDEPPGGGGAIGIPNIEGNKPEDIAVAAHEAFHAKLQSRSKNYHNEKVVNRLTIRWLQDHLSGMFLHMALERIGRSKQSYKKYKYDSTRKWLAKYKERFGDYK